MHSHTTSHSQQGSSSLRVVICKKKNFFSQLFYLKKQKLTWSWSWSSVALDVVVEIAVAGFLVEEEPIWALLLDYHVVPAVQVIGAAVWTWKLSPRLEATGRRRWLRRLRRLRRLRLRWIGVVRRRNRPWDFIAASWIVARPRWTLSAAVIATGILSGILARLYLRIFLILGQFHAVPWYFSFLIFKKNVKNKL